MILVTGATGHLGRAVVDALLLLRQPKDIAGLVRDPQKAADLDDKGIVLRVGDYDDTAAKFTIKNATKDLGYYKDMAATLHVTHPIFSGEK